MLLKNRFTVLIGCVFIQFAIGSVYTWGNITYYVTSRLRSFPDNSDVTTKQTIYAYALSLVCLFLLAPFSSMLAEKFGPRIVAMVGGVFMFIGVFSSAYTDTLGSFIFCYGVLHGIGAGLCYMPPIVAISHWFQVHRGLAFGICVAGMGVGSAVLNEIQRQLCNPHNAPKGKSGYFEPDIYDNVPYMFRSLAIIYICLVEVGAFLLFPWENTTPKPQEKPKELPVIEEEAKELNFLTKQETGVVKVSKSVHVHMPVDPDVARVIEIFDKSGKVDQEKEMGDPEALAFIHPEHRRKPVRRRKRTRRAVSPKPYPSSSSSSSSSSAATQPLVIKTPSQSLPNSSSQEGPLKKDDHGHDDHGHDDHSPPTLIPPTRLEVMKTWWFWFFPLALCFNLLPGLLTIAVYKDFGVKTQSLPDAYMTKVGAVAAVLNAAGRLTGGFVGDHVPFYVSIPILSCLSAFFILIYYPVGVEDDRLYFWITCMIYYFYGANYSLFPSAVVNTYGPGSSPIYGMVIALGGAPASIISALLNQRLQADLGFSGLFYIFGGINFVSIPCIMVVYYNLRYKIKHAPLKPPPEPAVDLIHLPDSLAKMDSNDPKGIAELLKLLAVAQHRPIDQYTRRHLKKLHAEEIYSLDDMRAVIADHDVWVSIPLPARLKVRMKNLLIGEVPNSPV